MHERRKYSRKKLSNNFKIEIEEIAKTKLKVIDTDIDLGSEEEIELDIRLRNFSNMQDNFQILHVYTNERTNKKVAIIEVTANIYKNIKDNKSRLFVGHLSCRVFEIINTTPCNKCARFGHSTKKCTNEATCNKCAGAHLPSKSNSATYKCPNCNFSNEKYKTKYNVNHSAIDSELCEILKC